MNLKFYWLAGGLLTLLQPLSATTSLTTAPKPTPSLPTSQLAVMPYEVEKELDLGKEERYMILRHQGEQPIYLYIPAPNQPIQLIERGDGSLFSSSQTKKRLNRHRVILAGLSILALYFLFEAFYFTIYKKQAYLFYGLLVYLLIALCFSLQNRWLLKRGGRKGYQVASEWTCCLFAIRVLVLWSFLGLFVLGISAFTVGVKNLISGGKRRDFTFGIAAFFLGLFGLLSQCLGLEELWHIRSNQKRLMAEQKVINEQYRGQLVDKSH